MIPVPGRTEAAEYYFRYIDLIREGDVRDVLERQGREVVALLRGVGEDRSRYRYAPEKWSIREVGGHLIDSERLFVFRAMWFARGHLAPLPSFDQDVAASAAKADDRPWPELIEELRTLRESTVLFFRALPDDAWTRRGIASDNPVTVRALAYIVAGHVAHHVNVLRDRYSVSAAP